jgi:hypothetical protein
MFCRAFAFLAQLFVQAAMLMLREQCNRHAPLARALLFSHPLILARNATVHNTSMQMAYVLFAIISYPIATAAPIQTEI